MMSWFLLMVQLFSVPRIAAGLNFSKPNCVNQCGGVKIPYPFGIGANCYYNQSYKISCNMSSVSPKPFLQHLNLEVLDIQWPGRYREWDADGNSVNSDSQLLTVALPRTNLCGGSSTKKIYSPDLKGSPYRFSLEYNSLLLEGCGTSAEIKQRNGEILAGCGVSDCGGDAFNTSDMPCKGVGCCQASLKPINYRTWESDVDFYEIDVILGESTNSLTCNASIALTRYDYTLATLVTMPINPIVLQWKATFFSPQLCHDGVTCACPFPYEGNTYLPNGCQVIQECQKCENDCQQVPYPSDNSTTYYYYCEHKRSLLSRRAAFLDIEQV